MNSIIRLFDRRAGYIAGAFAVLLAAVLPSLVLAAQVTERSIELSSSSVSATGVTYKVNFTPVSAAGAFVVDFCSNTPLYGEDCTTPTGFVATAADSTTTDFDDVAALDANTVRVTGAMTTTPVSVAITGITNPSDAGPLYARVITFDTPTHANAYVSNPVEPATNVGVVDNGSIALYITPTVGVSGAVLESMTFCVSKAVPTANCGGIDAPVLELGQDNGGIISLNSGNVYEGTINTQISTNAANGAIISLKSDATGCGGLKRAGAPTACDITPATTGGIAAGEAKFGVKLGADDTDASGTIRAFPTSGYNNSAFRLNYAALDASGVTSTYGDPFLDTNELPANNKNMALTFGASVSNNTPAGRYSAALSLIATGKF